MSIDFNSSNKGYKTKDVDFKNDCIKDSFDIRGVKVLTKDEWASIQHRLNKKEIEAEIELREKEKKEKIKECSHNLIQNWTNTVLKGSGARQKKLAERKIRLEKQENEKKALDDAEAVYQIEKRRKAIEESKLKQYFETDRVKSFHSALMYTEVLKEREAQIELKQLRHLFECNKNGDYMDKSRRENLEDLKAAQDRMAERRRKKVENTQFIKSQICYNREVRARERAECLSDGENIRQIAAAYVIEKQRLDQIDREEQRAYMQENLRQIDDVRRMKVIDKLRDEEYDDEIRIFAAAKKKMLKLRLNRENEIFTEKQETLDKIKKQLSDELKAKMDDEDTRIKSAVIEKEQKFISDEAEKDERRREMRKSIDEYRFDTVNRLEKEKCERIQNEKDELEARRQADLVLKDFEGKRQELRKNELRKLAADNLATAKYLKESDEYFRGNRLRAEEENQLLLDLEEKVFQDYATKIIEHCEKGNRNTHPLRVTANKNFGVNLPRNV